MNINYFHQKSCVYVDLAKLNEQGNIFARDLQSKRHVNNVSFLKGAISLPSLPHPYNFPPQTCAGLPWYTF